MQKKYYSPDEVAGGNGTETTAAKSPFADLTEDLFAPEYKAKEVKEEKVIETKVEEEIKAADPALTVPEEKKEEVKTEEKPEEKTESPTEEKVEEKKEEVFDLKLEDTSDTPEQTKVWVDTAKELFGKEIEADSYEAFVEASKIAIKEAEERGKATSIEKELSTLDPAAQVDFLLLRSGLTREEINEPTKKIDEILGMSDVDIVKKELELQGLSQEVIDKEIEILTEKGLIDHEAEKLKTFLHKQKEQIIEERKELAQSVAANYEAKRLADKQSEVQSIATAFDTVKDFMGSPINEDIRKALVKRYSDGSYDGIFNDPAKKAQFILFHQFGEQAIKNVRNKALEEGREKVTKHLSNIPPVINGNNSVPNAKQQAKSSSGFEALESMFN
jgi:hypothetical protein